MAKSKKQSRPGARDSETGRFITRQEAEKRPRRTQKESIPLPGYGDTNRAKKRKKVKKKR